MSDITARCEFCVDAGPDFDYCHVCGYCSYGMPAREAVEPMTGVPLAIRMAYGRPLRDDSRAEVEAFYAAQGGAEAEAMKERLRDG